MAQRQMTVSEALKAGYTQYGYLGHEDEGNFYRLQDYDENRAGGAGADSEYAFLWEKQSHVPQYDKESFRQALQWDLEGSDYAHEDNDIEEILQELDCSKVIDDLNALLAQYCRPVFHGTNIIVIPDPQPNQP